MNQSLQAGGNQTLQSFSGTVIVSHDMDSALDVNLTAFLLNDKSKVQDDEGLVFYNNPQDPNGMAVFIPPENAANSQKHKIHFDLKKAPNGISKLAITLTEDKHPNGFAAVKNLKAEVHTDQEIIELTPPAFSNEKGIIVLDLYLRNDQPKVKAVWQGFSSGLNGLCQLYGVEVESEETKPTPPPMIEKVQSVPPPSLSKSVITLTKQNESHKISLQKGSDAPKKILVSATWVDNGDGLDNDDLDLRVGILLPDGRMKMIQAPDKSGSFLSEPYVFHTGDVTQASVNAPGKETVEVNPEISVLMGGKVALVFSVYSAVSNGAVAIASLKPKMRMEYGDQIVECSFEFKKAFGASFVYTYVIGLIEIDQHDITLRPSGETSKMMSEATPWLAWHKDTVKLTMDGPAVFKGVPLSNTGSKRYC
jgi:tellurite resistance protein TerA